MINIEGLKKKYIIHHEGQERYLSLRDLITEKVNSACRRIIHPLSRRPLFSRSTCEEIWVLNDISCKIQKGERVGIIGHNGAGKSTLLKIISRITEPTSGRVELKGRVGSLLEVGTGFHPELTGRENIYLNGAILGMSRTEIRSKFDEIVSFAEVEKFLDTPVKRYSSGMYVRLAFAVAAHLEPEILLIDEVLAVGDAQFQKKCLNKMESIGMDGKTILFVSHNMAAVQAICTKAILLDSGKIVGYGEVSNQIDNYIASLNNRTRVTSNKPLRLGTNLFLHNFGFSPNPVESSKCICFDIEISCDKADRIDSIVIIIIKLGLRIAILDLRHFGFPVYMQSGSCLCLRGQIKSLPLVDGDYSAGLYIESNELRENYLDLADITVISRKNISGSMPYPSNVRGVLELDCNCEVSNPKCT
jgi:lipopolysaccharide transport system ATP-binding protein